MISKQAAVMSGSLLDSALQTDRPPLPEPEHSWSLGDREEEEEDKQPVSLKFRFPHMTSLPG